MDGGCEWTGYAVFYDDPGFGGKTGQTDVFFVCQDMDIWDITNQMESLKLYAPPGIFLQINDDPCEQSWELSCWFEGNGGEFAVPDLHALGPGSESIDPNYRFKCLNQKDSEGSMGNSVNSIIWTVGNPPF